MKSEDAHKLVSKLVDDRVPAEDIEDSFVFLVTREGHMGLVGDPDAMHQFGHFLGALAAKMMSHGTSERPVTGEVEIPDGFDIPGFIPDEPKPKREVAYDGLCERPDCYIDGPHCHPEIV